MFPYDQSATKNACWYFAGKREPVPNVTPVGEPMPVFTTAPRPSGEYSGHLPVPLRQPYSPPLTARLTRIGRYHGVPVSHSMSLSYVNSSPSVLKSMS